MGKDGDIVEFRNEPEIEDQESSWLYAIEILLEVIASLSAIFPGIDQARPDQCYADAHALKKAAAS